MAYRYEYTPSGQKSLLVWPDGTQIGYGYTAHGELESVALPGEGLITFSQFQWLAPGQITVPGGTRTSRRHDGLLQLEYQHIKTPGQQTVLDLQHTWGKAFELQAVQREQRDGDTLRRTESQYAYDAVLRLTGITTDRGGLFGGTTESLTLDAVANRLAQSTLSGDWIYDANDRLSQRGDVARYVYDESGNMVQKTEGTRITRYAYDTLNRLVEIRDASASPEGLVARYGYDPMGRRLWKEQFRDRAGQVLSPARRTYFLYADEGLIAEATQAISLGADLRVTASEAPLLTTQYGPKPDSPFTTGVLFVKTRNTKGEDTVAYYHHNHLQTPLLATDKLGRVVWAAEYHPFGAATLITPAASAENPLIVSNLRLPGQYADEESGLYYNWNRYYDPESGRYGSRDPIGLMGGVNTYAYVGGKPLSWIDTHGLFGDGRSYGIDMNAKGPKGHSDFYGGGLYGFDYVEEDHDFFSHPWNIFTGTANHFQDLKESEDAANETCDPKKFGRLMHRVQDYYSHYNRGYRYSPLAVLSPVYIVVHAIRGTRGYGLGHILDEHRPDNGDNDGSWDKANKKTKELVDKFYERCGCKK